MVSLTIKSVATEVSSLQHLRFIVLAWFVSEPCILNHSAISWDKSNFDIPKLLQIWIEIFETPLCKYVLKRYEKP